MVLNATLTRLAVIVLCAVAAHLGTMAIRWISLRILTSPAHSDAKVRTLLGFATSAIVFAIYFGAFGFILSELGVSLTTYLASASVIGLAVSFGSQGIVQDVITGLTVVFSDLIDVGDLVDLGGQVGIVERIEMRFTVLINFMGARVFVPNRSIANVVNYADGYVRAYVDVRLPEDRSLSIKAEQAIAAIAISAFEQYPGILLLPPASEGVFQTRSGVEYVRTKFKIWPGQGAVLETATKSAIADKMRSFEPSYADWMITVHYRAEPVGESAGRGLPRPAVLHGRLPDEAGEDLLRAPEG